MMPAGTYYVGDLCYVMDDTEWADFCKATIHGHTVLDGERVMSDGRLFASYGTAYGDGVYRDEQGREYPVDAGLIGCINVADIKQEIRKGSGHLIDFHQGFGTGYSNGVIHFGNIRIDTDPQDEDDDWEDEDEWENDDE